ncbi:hypothetical protein [Fictibacillus gelatini]|uniref:hypothetical protein n=1 Tax=Fictibacillus gelatini TaxID=225985 RepID=UPI00041C77CF|nr:hypothetical protein [Fictibacillus gelatini]
MRAGKIENFKLLSEFQTVEEFNSTIRRFLQDHRGEFTKGELLAFHHLTKFSIKVIGVCNAKIGTLVSSCLSDKGGVSRSTFERMLRKAKKLGILSIHHALRQKGGFAHNLFVFHQYDRASKEKLTEPARTEKPGGTRAERKFSQPETTSLETNKKIIKTNTLRLNGIDAADPDYTYLPDDIPKEFIHAVKPFFTRAIEIYSLWQKVRMAYRSFSFEQHLEELVDQAIYAFKVTVFQYKCGRIKTSFVQYFYGTLTTVFSREKRRERRRNDDPIPNWLEPDWDKSCTNPNWYEIVKPELRNSCPIPNWLEM